MQSISAPRNLHPLGAQNKVGVPTARLFSQSGVEKENERTEDRNKMKCYPLPGNRPWSYRYFGE